MAGAEVPGLIVDVQRGGPGLGTIQPSQSDYFQATRGGGKSGDYYVIRACFLQLRYRKWADFCDLSFTLSFKYRIPAMILSDGVIGQMMEKVVLPPMKPRRTEEEIIRECPWATTGRIRKGCKPLVITSLELKPEDHGGAQPAACRRSIARLRRTKYATKLSSWKTPNT